jgi:hypothetical protein
MLMVYCSTISIIFSLFMYSMPLLSTDSTYYGIHDHQALPISAYPSTIEIALAYMRILNTIPYPIVLLFYMYVVLYIYVVVRLMCQQG